MATYEYDYTQANVSINQLTYQIKTSSIASTLDHINIYGSAIAIFFTSSLSAGDQTTLGTLVTANTGVDLEEDFIELSSNSSTSTSSSSYVTLNSMTYSKLTAGKYLVGFSGSFSTNVPLLSSPGLYISVFANGTQLTSSEMQQNDNLLANMPFNMNTSIVVTLSSDYQTIELKWKNNNQGNTITATSRVLDITKVG